MTYFYFVTFTSQLVDQVLEIANQLKVSSCSLSRGLFHSTYLRLPDLYLWNPLLVSIGSLAHLVLIRAQSTSAVLRKVALFCFRFTPPASPVS